MHIADRGGRRTAPAAPGSAARAALTAATVLLLALVAAPRAALAAPAAAAPADRRLGILPFDGPGAGEVQRAVTAALVARGYRVIPVVDEPGVGVRGVSAELKLAAVIAGRVAVRGKQRGVRVVLRSGETGGILTESVWTAKGPATALVRMIQQTLWQRMGPMIVRARAPRAMEPGEDLLSLRRGEADAAMPISSTAPAPRTQPAPGGGPPPPVPAPAPAPPPEPPPPAAAGAPRAPASGPRAIAAAPTNLPREPARGAQTADGPPPTAAEMAAATPVAPTVGPDAAATRRSDDLEPPPSDFHTGRPAPMPFEVAVGPRFFYRQLTYTNDPDSALTEFRTKGITPALGLVLTWLPLRLTPRLGIAASVEQGARLTAVTNSNLAYDLPNSDYMATAIVGIPWQPVTVDLTVGVGWHRFGVVPRGASISRPRLVPDVSYQYLRAGTAARIHTGTSFEIFGGAFYRHVFRAGTIGNRDWFPALKVNGFEGVVGVSYRVWRSLEARLQVDTRLYRFAMNSQPTHARRADGAMDEYWSGWAALVVLLGNSPRPSPATASASPPPSSTAAAPAPTPAAPPAPLTLPIVPPRPEHAVARSRGGRP
jgi:hypothetical protein